MATKESSKVSVIEDYLDCIDSLPVDLSRMLTEIKEHDSLTKDNVKKLEVLTDDLNKTFLNNAETERLNLCNDLLSVLQENLILGEKKVELAQKTFDMVNARIKRIDEDAAIIEEEEFTSSKAQRNYTNDLNVITPIPDSKIIKPNIVLAPETEENTETKTNVNSTTTTNNTNKGDKKSTTDSSTLSKSRKRQREKEKDKDREKDKDKDKDKDKNDKETNDTKSPTPIKKESKHKNSLTSTKNSNKARKHSDIKHSKSSNNDKSVMMPSDLEIDPDEPTYCKCHQVSFGEMIACDNEDCAIEWFHYSCVGLVGPPKGKWYCDDCAALMAKKNKKK
ncbi:hypothetical protein H8356DRAFT_1628677 [Neocallimastix lanati (nom. inval.)]|jgi:hypothetical protein|uniref:Chromatin modification-related protein n=1 Tax=Neocallimastix californiae TaxID=1754190 RepID=A0A1Y2F869_9FUNG|nr:hypothetical protein H8356DRAFT_1628677 [Neocallimastix sp. JGI-2020a]ORY79664.1 hypothetical protein LY90DRAFT_449739 [Neocallimastix californiae]|eukprot:ORY79664.1 hypothetical protein LY90DRAFT_449739 [Neocallimastix californiae]